MERPQTQLLEKDRSLKEGKEILIKKRNKVYKLEEKTGYSLKTLTCQWRLRTKVMDEKH